MGGQRGNLGQRKEGPQTMDGNDLRNPGAGVGGGGWRGLDQRLRPQSLQAHCSHSQAWGDRKGLVNPWSRDTGPLEPPVLARSACTKVEEIDELDQGRSVVPGSIPPLPPTSSFSVCSFAKCKHGGEPGNPSSSSVWVPAGDNPTAITKSQSPREPGCYRSDLKPDYRSLETRQPEICRDRV